MPRKAIRILAAVAAIAIGTFSVLVVGGALAGANAGRDLGELNWRGLRDASCVAAASSADEDAHRYYVDNCKNVPAREPARP